MRLSSISRSSLASAVHAKSYAREDVQGERGAYEERFLWTGLVEWAGEEEVGFGGGD